MHALPQSSTVLRRLIRQRINLPSNVIFSFNTNGDLRRISAVLFLLSQTERDEEPFLILNKRSRSVRQPGDLCCPGGGVSPVVDSLFARGLSLPKMPLAGWEQGKWWYRRRGHSFFKLSLLLATALREGFEEMRLNPLDVQFLGPLPVQNLVMFHRAIYPMVGWVRRQEHFEPNWEVEDIVRIPLASFFDNRNYARFIFSFDSAGKTKAIPDKVLPCFVHRHKGKDEILWGATFRITASFLSTVFGYQPPPLNARPLIQWQFGPDYFKGAFVDKPVPGD